MTPTITSPFAASVLPITVAPGASDEQIEDLARAAIEYAEVCEEEFEATDEAHTEEMASPGHGSDYDPCGICEPYNRDRAIADVAAYLRQVRDDAAAN